MSVVLVLLLGMTCLFVGLPTWLWWTTRREALTRWLPRAVGTEHVGEGSYRDANLLRVEAHGAPRVVEVTAILCFVLGTMFVPGLLGGLYGLLAAGIGLVSIPGLMLAWRLFALGGPLMRAEPESAGRARAAARFARVLNAIVLSICALVAMLLAPDLLRRPTWSGESVGFMMLTVAVAVYATISLVHAKLLDRSADHVDAECARRAEESTRVRVDASPAARAPFEAPVPQEQIRLNERGEPHPHHRATAKTR